MSTVEYLSAEDLDIVQIVREQTAFYNRNNVTRTKAYLDYFDHHPEIHWALLAHSVSRNGGWGMTDVKGEWFARIASPGEDVRFFGFLERVNWLIFGDAFPQLLLYEEGKRRERNLSRLLDLFHVSRFMREMWNVFWEKRESQLLTRALIVNEQNYVESRAIHNPKYKQSVIMSLEFQAQSLLNLNQAIFPFCKGNDIRLAGTLVKQFVSIDDRIVTGIQLYHILFEDRLVHQAILKWMRATPHTGSRADFWPHYFTDTASSDNSASYEPRFIGHPSAERRIYSPKLLQVWRDVAHHAAEPGDWFNDLSHAVHLFGDIKALPADFTDRYVQSLQTIEGVMMVKETIESVIR